MKYFIAILAVVLLSGLVSLPLAKSQDNPATEIKNISLAPLNGVRGGGRAAALSIERGARYPSVIHLKGKVEVRTNGFVLLADEADHDEATGEVQAHGNVTVKPYPPVADFTVRPKPQ